MRQSMKTIWLTIALSTLGLFASGAMAAEFSMATRGGKAFSMETAAEQVTQRTNDFVICGEGIESLAKVKLWMPEHNHGSSAVQIGSVSEGCRLITRVNFTMPGLWEVRVELSDGDSGAFALDVE